MLMNDLEQIARRDFAKYLYDKYYQYSQDAVPEFDTLTEYDNYNQSLDKFKIQIPFSTDKEARLEMTELIQDPEFREAWANYSRDDSILDTLYFGPEEVYRVGYLAAEVWIWRFRYRTRYSILAGQGERSQQKYPILFTVF